jgi:AcrR family transcriptional regulator
MRAKMSERSQAFNRLCDAALLHFAKDGYDRASLSTIADALGIRKASLYSHVKSKDELYLLLVTESIEAEEAFAQECFHNKQADIIPGNAYIEALGPRFLHSLNLQFLLKAAYFPPEAHRSLIADAFTTFNERLRELFLADFDKRYSDSAFAADKALFAESWLGIVDSICVEMLYGSEERSTRRKDAMQMLLTRALQTANTALTKVTRPLFS